MSESEKRQQVMDLESREIAARQVSSSKSRQHGSLSLLGPPFFFFF